ncbi:MAG TPA: type II toxin-antitoxin system RelE/ParE family toxin [Edaphobacter sp.]|jgi:plasmid stabilization system protein ParE|nr:type II toxin-antitoxin system RelE/ParE family toxin [Edaphobacter sp.]
MTTARRSIDISRQAAQEILTQAIYYRERTLNDQLPLRWQQAVSGAIDSLLRFPERGSLCQFESDRLKGMRRLAIKGFPNHAIYYIILREDSEIHIARVVHGARDLETVLE